MKFRKLLLILDFRLQARAAILQLIYLRSTHRFMNYRRYGKIIDSMLTF
jgi:hypothetical protein